MYPSLEGEFFLPLAPPGKPHMASKVIESGFYSKDNLKLQNVFKNGDQKQDGLIEYVFAPFSVENKLDNQDIICSREHFPWYKQETMLKQKKKKKKNWLYEWFRYMVKFEICRKKNVVRDILL